MNSMRRPFLSALALSAGWLLAAAAQAADEPKFNVMGPSTCAGWPKSGSIGSAQKAVPLNWVLGYLSGYADQTNPAMLPAIDPEMADQWLTTYCAANPSHTLPLAVRMLKQELEAKVGPPAPPPAPRPPPMFFTPPPQAAAPATPAKPTPAKRRRPK